MEKRCTEFLKRMRNFSSIQDDMSPKAMIFGMRNLEKKWEEKVH